MQRHRTPVALIRAAAGHHTRQDHRRRPYHTPTSHRRGRTNRYLRRLRLKRITTRLRGTLVVILHHCELLPVTHPESHAGRAAIRKLRRSTQSRTRSRCRVLRRRATTGRSSSCRSSSRRRGRRRSGAVIQILVPVPNPPLTRPRPIIGETPLGALPIRRPRTPISRTSRSSRRRRRGSRGSSAVVQILIPPPDPFLAGLRPVIGETLLGALPIRRPRTPISRTSRSSRRRRRGSRGSSAVVQILIPPPDPFLAGLRPVIGETLLGALPIGRPRTPVVVRS